MKRISRRILAAAAIAIAIAGLAVAVLEYRCRARWFPPITWKGQFSDERSLTAAFGRPAVQREGSVEDLLSSGDLWLLQSPNSFDRVHIPRTRRVRVLIWRHSCISKVAEELTAFIDPSSGRVMDIVSSRAL